MKKTASGSIEDQHITDLSFGTLFGPACNTMSWLGGGYGIYPTLGLRSLAITSRPSTSGWINPVSTDQAITQSFNLYCIMSQSIAIDIFVVKEWISCILSAVVYGSLPV